MGNKKGGKGAKSYDYYGTLAGLICWGPVDTLQAVIVDGKTIVTGPVALSTAANNLTLDPDQGKYLDKGGRITIYKGTQTTADAALAGHPAYVGMCYIVLKGLLFGRERTSAPSVQVIVSRKPVADASIVSPSHNTLTADGQCNPVAALVEVLTSAHGLSIPVSALDATSWLAAAAWAADVGRVSYTHCSPLFTSNAQARRQILELLLMVDATLYWTPGGKLGIALIEPGVTPASPKTLDARHIVERHRLEALAWQDVPTTQEVRYRDRDAKYKDRPVKADNLLALRLRSGVPMLSKTDRPLITGADQASRHAVELIRRTAQPTGEVEIKIRRPFAAGLYPGAKLLVDVDPEPGGTGLAQLCVVQEIRDTPFRDVSLRLRPDTLVASTLYSPAWATPTPQAADCPPIVAASAVVVPMPIAEFPTPSVVVLAPRPAANVIGMRIYLSEDGTTFADLGTQPGFSCRAALGAGIDNDDESVILTLPDGDSGPDAYLAERYPTTAVGAASDDLLLIIANVDVNGRVVITSGEPEMEVCSIQTRVLMGSDMTYTILRARLGTPNRAWTTSAKAWITLGSTLNPLTHPVIEGMVLSGAVGYVRMVATTGEAEDDTVPIPERTFYMPTSANSAPVITWATPSGSTGTTDGSGNYTAQVHIDDAEGDLMKVEVFVVNKSTGASLQWLSTVLGGVSRHPASGELSIPLTQLEVGNHDLIVTADDRRNPTVSSHRTIYRAATSGTVIAPPSFNPPGRVWAVGSLTVTITCASPANRMEWVLTEPGSASPPSSTPVLATSFTLKLFRSHRLWVRAGDGTTWGAWTSADFQKTTTR